MTMTTMDHEHEHDFRVLRHRVRGPVGPPPGHTEFVLLECPCGVCTVFPQVNYELIDPVWRATFERVYKLSFDDARWDGGDVAP